MKTCSNIEPNTVFAMLGAAYAVDFERLVVLDIMKAMCFQYQNKNSYILHKGRSPPLLAKET